jgi:amino acid transporter
VPVRLHCGNEIADSRIASYAELGSAIPLNGGAYAYLNHIFGPLWAFLFSWTAITTLKPGSAAIIAIIFAEYINRLLFLSLQPNDATPLWADKLVALLCVWVISGLNALSTKWGTVVNNVFTMFKLLALAAVAIIGIVVLGILYVSSTAHIFRDRTWRWEFQSELVCWIEYKFGQLRISIVFGTLGL